MKQQISKQKSLFLYFTKYVSLNVLGMIGLSCYILADTFFVANGVGSNGLTALNIVLPVYSFISGIGLMIGMGGATKYSIMKGQERSRESNGIFTTSIIIALLMGVTFSLIGMFCTDTLVTILGADNVVKPFASVYLKTIMIFSGAFLANNVMLYFVRNDGNPNLSMLAMLLGSFSNIILDYIFVFPFKLGMFGAAIATCIAPIISIIILSTHWRRKNNNLSFVKISLKFKMIQEIFAVGFSSFITEFSSGIVMLTFNFIILSLAGNMGVAAYGVIANLALIVVAIYTGIGQGIQPIISDSYGKGKLRDIKKIYTWAIMLSIIIGVILYILGLVFADPIVAIFNKEQNQQLAAMAVVGVRLYFLAFLIMGVNIITTSLFASISRPKSSFIISFIRGFLTVFPIVIIMSKLIGMNGVWITIPVVEILTFIISLFMVYKLNKSKYNKTVL